MEALNIKLQIANQDIISKENFKKTDCSRLFINKDDQQIAFVLDHFAIVFCQDEELSTTAT